MKMLFIGPIIGIIIGLSLATFLIHDAITKTTIKVENRDIAAPPWLRLGKFTGGLSIIILMFFAIRSEYTDYNIGASGRSDRTQGLPLALPNLYGNILDSLSPAELASLFRQRGTEDPEVVTAILQLKSNGTYITLDATGQTDVWPLSRYDEEMVATIVTLYETLSDEAEPRSPLDDLLDYPAERITAAQLLEDCRDQLATNLRQDEVPEAHSSQPSGDTVHFELEYTIDNQNYEGFPELLTLSTRDQYGREQHRETLLGIQVDYVLTVRYRGDTQYHDGTIVPEYGRYTWQKIDRPYRLIGRLLGETLADELVTKAAKITTPASSNQGQ